MSRWAAWRGRPYLWGVPLTFFAIALGLFVFYRIAYAGQVEVLQDRYEAETANLRQLTAQRKSLESYLGRVTSSSVGANDLYLNHFSTEAERFTATIAEIRRLARTAGLDPTAFSYPSVELKEIDLRYVGISFGVNGTYDQLRRFINLLELSDHFLILEQVGLTQSAPVGGNAPTLSIRLSLSTIFLNDELARRVARDARQSALRARLTDSVGADRDSDGSAAVETDEEPHR